MAHGRPTTAYMFWRSSWEQSAPFSLSPLSSTPRFQPSRQATNLPRSENDDYVLDHAFEADFAADTHRTFEPEELISYVYPGTDRRSGPWQYVNTQYVLAGMIASKASGMSYADALKEKIFEPLQLHQTYYRPRVPPKRVLDLMPSALF
jgi:hypothetical protein